MTDKEPLWIRILLSFYRRSMIGDSFDEHGYSKMARKKAVADEIEGEESEIYDAISSLEDLGLIREPTTGQESQGFRLTKDGFEVAHEIDSQKRQDRRNYKLNRAVAILTIGLVLIGFVQAVITALTGNTSPTTGMLLALAGGFIVVLGIIGYLFRYDLISSWEE